MGSGLSTTAIAIALGWWLGVMHARRGGGYTSAHVAADARLEETCALRRTIGTGPTGSRSSRCAERSDGLDGSQARLWGRLCDIVDEYLREDRPR